MTEYKKYALSQVENFLYDAMSAEATPQEIYDTIRDAVQDNLNVYTKSADQARQLLSLLNGHRPVDLDLGPSFYSEGKLDIPIKSKDKVIKWSLPVEEQEDGEYYITLPDDLLEAADLKEGDQIEWIEQDNSSYILQKPSWVKGNELAKVKTHQEMIDDGWTMTADGFWIKEN